MKKILFLIDTTGPGGAETLYIQLLKYFSTHNYSTLAIIHGPGWVKDQLTLNNIEFQIFPGKGSFNFLLLFKLVRVIKKLNIDIIHAHLFGSNTYASLAGIITKTPVISTFHGLVDINISDKLLRQKIAIVNKGSYIVAVSERIKTHLLANTSLNEPDILLIPNGIDNKHDFTVNFPAFRSKYNLPDSSVVIGCLGNVRPAKDYSTAIKTIKLLDELNCNVSLLIAGATNHELYNQHLSLIEKYNLKHRIQFIGFIDDPLDFLLHLDIFLMTSSSEGQPISLFQAMSCKLPIVGTRCGIEDVLIDGETAWLSPVRSEKSLSDNISSIIANPDEARRRGNNARQYVIDHYNIDAMFKKYEELYHLSISE